MEQLMAIKETLIGQVQAQMGDLKKVNAKELGEVIDMIKDIAETEYYCSVTEAMTDAKEEKERGRDSYYYTEKYYPYRDMDRDQGRMYYTETDYPISMRDDREGRSPMKRKMYMESKDSHADSAKSMRDLENYMQELTSDMMELISKASPEEKAIVQKKIATLASKMQSV